MARPPGLPLARLLCVSASPAEWVTAAATCVLGIGGIGAFVYAARTYSAQNAQLQLAKQDSVRLRAPILRGEISAIGQGVPSFRLDVWLSTPEPLASLRVIIEEARGGDCPLGFTAGQTGVEQHPDQDALPPGWRNDVLRHEARWDALMPGSAATWQMAIRNQAQEPGTSADPGKVRLRAECRPVSGGEPWRVHVPVTITVEAVHELPGNPEAWNL
jgi:hypothetical protein